MKAKLVAVLTGVVGFGAVSAASAADMAVKAPLAPPPAPVFSWTGFYIGANVGGMWADKNWTERCSVLIPGACVAPENPAAPSRTSHQVTSGIAGGQIGYNWQINNFVLGIEGDASGAWNDETCSQITGNQGGFFQIHRGSGCSKVDWLATVTGRAGVTFGQALFYGKGGVAFAHDSYVVRCTTLNALPVICPVGAAMTTSPSENRVGWTVGVGVEYAFTANWSIKGEYNYMDFGTETNRFQTIRFAGLPADSIHDVGIRQHVNVAKVGVNYRFGGPVVAKY